MNKKLIIGAAVGGAVVAAAAKNRCTSPGPKPTAWDKMRERMEEMPEDFPPRVMFDNVEATRANSERILDLLETRQVHEDESAVSDDTEVLQPS